MSEDPTEEMIVGVKSLVRRGVRKTGFDIARYKPPAPAARQAESPRVSSPPPDHDDDPAMGIRGVPPSEVEEWRRVGSLTDHLQVDLLIDVGANEGQYARGMRAVGYAGRIISFEPIRSAYTLASKHALRDPLWRIDNVALGRETGTATINVAANAAQSSSILPMLERHEQAAPKATYVGTEHVQVRRLDDVVPADYVGLARVFLKIDTQGFEAEVLAGATELLAGPVVGVQLELSLVPLYAGAPLYLEIIAQMAAYGFRLGQVIPGFSDPDTGEMLQFDGIFIRQV